MAILGYFDVFPEKTQTELRTAHFDEGNAGCPLPDGTYVFTEYFCTDLSCDCQRVLVKVFHVPSEGVPPEEVATIGYTWNPNGDDEWEALNLEIPNPYLDPLHRQVSYASELLDFWSAMVEHDRAYALRLQRHYDEIRAEIGQTEETGNAREFVNHEPHKNLFRPRTKADRRTRRRRLARARGRK